MTASAGRFSARFSPALLFVGLVLVLYADPVLFSAQLRRPRPARLQPPDGEERARRVGARAVLPVWQPEISGGRPLLPNPNAGALYPVRPGSVPRALSARDADLPDPALGRGGDRRARCSACARALAVRRVDRRRDLRLLGRRRVGGVLSAHPAGHGASAVDRLGGCGARPARAPRGSCFSPASSRSTCSPATSSRSRSRSPARPSGSRSRSGRAKRRGRSAAGWRAPRSRSRRSPRRPQIVATALWIPETNRAVIGMKLGGASLYSILPVGCWSSSFRFRSARRGRTLGARDLGLADFPPQGDGPLPDALLRAPLRSIAAGRRRGGRASAARGLRASCSSLAARGLRVPSLLPESLEDSSSPLPLRNPEKFAVASCSRWRFCPALAFDDLRRRPRRLPG